MFEDVIPPGIVLPNISNVGVGEETSAPTEVIILPTEPDVLVESQEDAQPESPTTSTTFVETVIAAVQNVTQDFPATIESVTEQVREVIDEPVVEQAASVVAAPVATVATAAIVVPSLFSIVFPLLRFLFLQPLMFLGVRKRREWGEVYNSLTKLPIGLAIVRLVNPETNRVVESHVTDPLGRYVFLPKPGKYVVEVTKAGYAYPSRVLSGATQDGERGEIYDGTAVPIEEGQPITKAIPVDPIDADVSNIKHHADAKKKAIQFTVAGVGVVTTAASLIIAPSLINAGLLAFHVVTTVVFSRVHRPKMPKGAGGAVDAQTGKKIKKVIVRLFSSQYNKLIDTAVTGNSGQYAFLTGAGDYYLIAEKPGYNAVRIPITVTDAAKTGVITPEIRMTKSSAGAPPIPSVSQNDQSSLHPSADAHTPTPAQTASASGQDPDQLRARIDGPSS